MKTIVIWDGDILSYRAAAVIEERSVRVTHEPSGKSKIFKNRTECKKSLEQNGRVFDPVIYKFEDIQVAEPAVNAFGIIKNQIEKTNDKLFADEYLVCLSGKSNFRDRLPLPALYKGQRVNTMRPVHLKACKTYLYKNHPSQLAIDKEADDDLIIKGYEYLEKGYNVIIAGQDKDSRAYSGLNLYNFTTDNPEIEIMPKFGRLYDTGKDIKGEGFIWFCHQWLYGDPTDNYKPCELARVRFGEKGSYGLLKDARDEKDALEIVIEQYNKWYSKGVGYVDCFGEKRFVDSDFLLDMYFKCARMMAYEDDPLDYHLLCKQYGVKI